MRGDTPFLVVKTLACALMLAQASGARAVGPQRLVVVADAARVRASASADAPVTAVLHIGSDVTVKKASGDWRHVTLVGRPDVTGFVDVSLIGAPLSVETLRETRDGWVKKGDWKNARAPAERAVALSDDARDLRALIDVLVQLDDKAAAARVTARLAGAGPAIVAECFGDRAVVLGRIDDDGFRKYQFQKSAQANQEEKARRNEDPAHIVDGESGIDGRAFLELLQRERFFAVSDNSTTSPMVGSPFPRPFFAPLWNEEDGTNIRAGSSELDGGERIVVLGPCHPAGMLYTSAPNVTVPLAAPSLADAPALFGAATAVLDVAQMSASMHSVEGVRLVRPTSHSNLSIAIFQYTGMVPAPTDEPSLGKGERAVFLDEKNRAIKLRSVQNAMGVYEANAPAFSSFSLSRTQKRTVFTVVNGIVPTNGEAVLVIVSDDKARVLDDVMIDVQRSGC